MNKKPFYLFKSEVKNKKWSVCVPKADKLIKVDFGHTDYQDFTQHEDIKRKKSYLARASKITDKNGNFASENPYSPNFWSINTLWNYTDIQKSFEYSVNLAKEIIKQNKL
jgi:hypothetical protein